MEEVFEILPRIRARIDQLGGTLSIPHYMTDLLGYTPSYLRRTGEWYLEFYDGSITRGNQSGGSREDYTRRETPAQRAHPQTTRILGSSVASAEGLAQEVESRLWAST